MNTKKVKFAEDADYWRTGKSRTPDQWIDMAIRQLESHGAAAITNATSRAGEIVAYMIAFQLDGRPYKIVWPALKTRSTTDDARRSAAIQAATSLYHEVKNCCVVASRYGVARGFFQYAMLPDGRSVYELSGDELTGQTFAIEYKG